MSKYKVLTVKQNKIKQRKNKPVYLNIFITTSVTVKYSFWIYKFYFDEINNLQNFQQKSKSCSRKFRKHSLRPTPFIYQPPTFNYRNWEKKNEKKKAEGWDKINLIKIIETNFFKSKQNLCGLLSDEYRTGMWKRKIGGHTEERKEDNK